MNLFATLWILAPALQETSFQERLLSTIPDGAEIESPHFPPDGKTVAYWAKKGGKEFVVVGDRKGEEFDSGYLFGLMADATPVYRAWVRAQKKNYLIVGQKKSDPFDSAHEAAWSADGKVVAFVADINYEKFAVVGGRRGPIFKYVGTPVLNADGSVVAYRTEIDYKKACVVVNDKPGEEFENVDPPLLSPSGTVAYVAERGGKRFLVVGGKKREEFDSILQYAFRRNGELVVLASRGDQTLLGIGNQERKIEKGDGFPTLFAESGEVAWIFNEGKWDKAYVTFRGKKGEEFHQVSSVTCSPDGKRIAYVGMKHQNFENHRHWLVVDDQKTGECEGVSSLVFSPDGSTVACVVKRGEKQFLLAGGKKSEEFDWVDRPVFSKDGQSVGFGAKKGREIWWKVLQLK